MDFLDAVFTASILYESAFRLAVVLAFVAVGEWVAERSGTLNISVEGMLLAGAFFGAWGYQLGDNAAVGLVCGALAGIAVSWLQANLSHRLTANQFVVGLTLNILLLGLTAFLDSEIKPGAARAGVVEVPLLSEIPLVGTALFAQAWPGYLIYPLVPAAWWLVYRTRWGLELRAVGENPQSADVSGIDVNRRRREGIYVAGLTSGIGGAFLVLGQVGQFQPNMSAGRGFIALAAVIFGGWTLRGAVAGCGLFGLVEAFGLRVPSAGYDVNPQLLDSLPYIVALLTMVVFAHRVRPPVALARPFIRGLK